MGTLTVFIWETTAIPFMPVLPGAVGSFPALTAGNRPASCEPRPGTGTGTCCLLAPCPSSPGPGGSVMALDPQGPCCV